MKMTFFTSTDTPLFSDSWAPSGTSNYAGTCIFLIFFGVIFEALLAARVSWQRKLREVELNRRVIIVDDTGKRNEVTATSMTLRSTVEDALSLTVADSNTRPWRLRTDVPRAALDTTIAGVAYLL